VARGALAFAVAAPLVYVALRLVERLHEGGASPGSIVRTSHTAYFWRAAVAVWWGGLVALVVAARASGDGRVVPLARAGAALLGAAALLAVLYP
jgi:hypothetical protein